MEPPDQPGQQGWGARLRSIRNIITIEPAIFLQTFTWGLQSACHDLGYPPAVCQALDQNTAVQEEVQTRVTELNTALSMLSALPSIVLALFIGPWSDRHGRKPVMLLPQLGYILSTLVWILNVHFMAWPAQYLLATGVYSFFGGFVCLLIGMYAYLADVTSARARTTRIGLLDIFLFAGVPAGTFSSAYLYTYTGYYGVFLTVLGIQLVCIAYISVGVEDSRGPGSRYSYPDTELELVRGSGVIRRYLAILDRKQLAEVFRVTFKRREGGMRRVILCLVLLMLLNVTIFSDGGVLYLFARKQFHWDEQIYTKFLTCTIIVSAVAAFIVMPFLSFYWKFHDATIGIFSTVSKTVSLVVIAFAWNGWVLFVGSCLGFLSAFAAIVIRSLLSKCVSPAELGKIFSLLASLEAAVPLFAAPLFSLVYTATLDSWPGAVFAVQAGIFVLSGLGFTYIHRLLRHNTEFGRLEEETPQEQREILAAENCIET